MALSQRVQMWVVSLYHSMWGGMGTELALLEVLCFYIVCFFSLLFFYLLNLFTVCSQTVLLLVFSFSSSKKVNDVWMLCRLWHVSAWTQSVLLFFLLKMTQLTSELANKQRMKASYVFVFFFPYNFWALYKRIDWIRTNCCKDHKACSKSVMSTVFLRAQVVFMPAFCPPFYLLLFPHLKRPSLECKLLT